MPQGWTISHPVELTFDGAGDKYAKLTVTPPQKIAGRQIRRSRPTRNSATRNSRLRWSRCRPLPTQLWSEPAQCVVHAFDINVPANLARRLHHGGKRAGARGAASGWAFTWRCWMPRRSLSAICRASTRSSSACAPTKCATICRAPTSGCSITLPMAERWSSNTSAISPGTARSTRRIPPRSRRLPDGPLPRVTDENSPVKFLKPDDPLLNTPNKITQDDFKGWVQERGALFLDAVRSEIHAAAGDERSRRARSKRRAGLHALWQRNLHLHRHRVLPPTARRRVRGVSLVRQSHSARSQNAR